MTPPASILHRTLLQKARALRADHWEQGEINLTSLAEDVAIELEHEEWLDDETHALWEVVVGAAEEIDGLR